MRKNLSLSAFLIFFGLWAVYCGLGQLLAQHFGFLTLENVIISSRAILATRGDALTLLSLGVPHPPLPFVLTLPFAAIGLMNPAIWMSSLLGAGICAWFFVWFRHDVARIPILVLLLVMLPVLPGLVHSACGGTSGIAVLALLVFSIHLAARFALEQQSLNDLRADGRLSAWVDTARDQAHAIRFLWAAALLLGFACCAQPGLILALPVFLLVTPLLLPPKERGQGRRIVTIALLLYLPIVAVHVASGALSAMFDHDFFRGLRPAASSFSNLGSLHLEGRPSALAVAMQLFLGLALTCPPFLYLLVRLRNPAVALLGLIPFLVIWIEASFGGATLSRAPFTLATLLAVVLIFLGARLNRFRRLELAALVATTALSAAGAWMFFSVSPEGEERALGRLVTGRTGGLATFSDERILAGQLGNATCVLIDEKEGAAFITLLNDPGPFLLSHETRGQFALSNPQIRTTHLLMRSGPGSRDAVAGIWPSLGREKTVAFRETAHLGAMAAARQPKLVQTMNPLAVAALALLLALAGCKPPAPPSPRIPLVGADFAPEFQKGVCFSHNHSLERGYGSGMERKSLLELRKVGANYVSISPIGYSFNLRDPRIFGYTGEDLTMTPERVRQTIRDAHDAGLKVLLSPHIWIGMYGSPGEWRGDVAMQTDADWRKWFASYREFILFFARMAGEEGVELFCVGSEMRAATKARPEDWRRLIPEVRGVYRGPCTYSANWSEELDQVNFWDQLEYVGISAYFPIGGGTLDQRLAEAAKISDRLGKFSRAWKKPILFLESGFRSASGAGKQPSAWQDGGGAAADPEEQRLSYEVWLRAFWGQPWFYGVYWWQWFSDLDYAPQPPSDFQFRNKPAEMVVRDYFARPAQK